MCLKFVQIAAFMPAFAILPRVDSVECETLTLNFTSQETNLSDENF